VIITSRDDIVEFNNDFILFQIQRVCETVVRDFLTERLELLERNRYAEGEINDLTANLRTPLLINAFDSIIRVDDRIKRNISVGMFPRPTNKGQIFYNYLCCEMFKFRDNHQFDKNKYANCGLIFFKYVVPKLARNLTTGNMADISQFDAEFILGEFLLTFNERYVESNVFDDLKAVSRSMQSANLAEFISREIGTEGQSVIDILMNNYSILYAANRGNPFMRQRFRFEHPVLGEVLAALDIWNELAIQNTVIDFNVCESVMSKALPYEQKELLSDFCAYKVGE